MEPTGLPQYVHEPEVHPALAYPDYHSTGLEFSHAAQPAGAARVETRWRAAERTAPGSE